MTGLVFGILAIVFCWTSFFDVPFVILGLVFSILGISDAKKGAGGRGLSMWGLWLAIVGGVGAIVLTIVYVVVGVSSDNSCANDYGAGTSQYYNCVND